MASTAGLTFLGIGAQKAGTTWLHEMLKLHPSVDVPKSKEQHYWDRERLRGRTLEEYEAVFSSMTRPIRGEITPGYAILPPEIIAMVKERYPDVRLLYTLRNPLERAWSNAKMFLVLHRIVADESQVDSVGDDWYIEHFHSDLSMRRGDYETCLQNWLAHFERSQILVSLYDDLVQSPRTFLERTCRHIGADPDFYQVVGDEVLQNRVYSTLFSEIRPSLLPVLKRIYAGKIQRLSSYLGVDLAARWLA